MTNNQTAGAVANAEPKKDDGSNKKDAICKNCKICVYFFYNELKTSDGLGIIEVKRKCRYDPPNPIYGFPSVDEDMWCRHCTTQEEMDAINSYSQLQELAMLNIMNKNIQAADVPDVPEVRETREQTEIRVGNEIAGILRKINTIKQNDAESLPR